MTRGSDGPLTIEIKYRERPKTPLITYHLSVKEANGRPVVAHEWLRWKRKPYGAPFRFLENSRGYGQAVSGEMPDEEDKRVDIALISELRSLSKCPGGGNCSLASPVALSVGPFNST